MEFKILGPVRVRHGDREARLTGRLQSVLLGVLLARANQVVPAEVLSDAMWGERRAHRTNSLHVQVHRLRRLLAEPDRLTSTAGGYLLTVRPGELDATRFESLVTEAAELVPTDPRRAAELLRNALRHWHGEPFGGVDATVLASEAHRLAERRLAAIEELYAAELACGRHAAVVGELAGLVRSHPLRERLHGLLMVALYRGGQQGAALATYRGARRLLIDELGQEPGPELRDLEQRILAGEPVDLGHRMPGPVPAQLPHDVRDFTGRDTELSTLDDLVTGSGPVLISAVAGTGGVGKTALAVRWAHRVRARFPDGQLYVDLRGFGPEPPLSPDDALAGFLRELGVDSAAIPGDRAERAARFRSLVAGRRVLILLDNARSAEQVRPLLPGGPPSLVLVTSRDSLAGLVAREGARRVFLDRLPEEDAAGLLRGLIGDRVDADADATRTLISRCARLPLALRIAAELVNSRPRRSLDDLVTELADQQRALDVLDAGGDPHTAVRAVFSWSYQQLSPDAARLFRYLSLHPGHDVDASALAALIGAGSDTAAALIDTLVRAHLLDEAVSGRYQAHDLLLAYAADRCQATDSDVERDAARDRLFDHYRHTAAVAAKAVADREPHRGQQVPEPATRWLDTERANLVWVATQAARHGRPRVVTDLAATLRRYLSLGGHHDEALAIFTDALAAARELGDLVEEGNAARYLGSVHRRSGHLENARTHYHRAYACYQQAGHRRHLALQLNSLGVTYTWLGRYPEALDYLWQALALSGELAADGRLIRLGALTYFGQLHWLRGEGDTALGYLERALDLPADPRERLDTDAIVGAVYDQLGRYEQARHHLERARSLALEMGNKLIQGYVFPLGHVYWRLGRRDDAFDSIEECLAVAVGANERLLESEVRNAIGRLHRLDGAHADALRHHRAAIEVAKATGRPHAEADAYAGIAAVHEELGEHAEASAHRQRALDLYRTLGLSDVSGT